MNPVAEIVKELAQTKVDHLLHSSYESCTFDDGVKTQYLHPSMDKTVNYLVRFMLGKEKEKTFFIPLLGSNKVDRRKEAEYYLNNITGLDTESVKNAYKLVSYEKCLDDDTLYIDSDADETMITDIKIMTLRTLNYFIYNGPIIDKGIPVFGNFDGMICDDCFLSYKSFIQLISSEDDLNIDQFIPAISYYLLGYLSAHDEYENIQKIRIFNPFLNQEYSINISDIPISLLNDISQKIWGVNYNAMLSDRNGKTRYKKELIKQGKESKKDKIARKREEVFSLLHLGKTIDEISGALNTRKSDINKLVNELKSIGLVDVVKNNYKPINVELYKRHLEELLENDLGYASDIQNLQEAITRLREDGKRPKEIAKRLHIPVELVYKSSTRRKKVALMVKSGYSSVEISRTLGISTTTVTRDTRAMDAKYQKNLRHSKIGISRMMKCGLIATIIEWNTAQDIGIEFIDGTVVNGVTYKDFLKGECTKTNAKE